MPPPLPPDAMGDIIFGVIFVGLALGIYFHSQTFPKPLGQPGPGLFPQIVSLLLLGASTFLVVSGVAKRSFRKFSWRKLLREVFSPGARNFLGTVSMVLIYLFISPHIGFFLSAMLILFLLMLQLKVHPVVAFSVAVMVAAISRLLFQNFLKIPLPPGPFPGGW